MSKIIDNKGTIFGAIKLIEQLYLDGQIPGYIFRNILKEYGNDIEIACFKCYENETANEVCILRHTAAVGAVVQRPLCGLSSGRN